MSKHPKSCYETLTTSFPIQGTKKPECRTSLFTRRLRFEFQGREIYQPRTDCQQAFQPAHSQTSHRGHTFRATSSRRGSTTIQRSKIQRLICDRFASRSSVPRKGLSARQRCSEREATSRSDRTSDPASHGLAFATDLADSQGRL